MNNNLVKIYTLGCKVNQYDSDDLSKKLNQISFDFVEKNADWAIVNTCAVTKNAIRKDRQMISKARNENPEAKIVLFGCFPEVYKDEANELGVDYIFGVREGRKIVELLRSNLNKSNYSSNRITSLKSIKKKGGSRYFLKIQDGCEQFCTYCIIPYTRGKLTSRSEDEVIKEAEEEVSRGCKEIVLTGIHLGLYGQDDESKKLKVDINLIKLLNRLLKIKKLIRIRLSSIEINEVSDELIDLIQNNERICNHLHIPLQSGCDKILKLMNRPYDTRYFKERISKIRDKILDIAISADVIIGFPGEGDNEFKETYDFVDENKFSKLHVFPYSAHEKTPAFKFPDQVKENIKLARAKKLRKLGEKLEQDYKNNFIDREVEVLIENIKNGIARGKSEYYIDYMLDNNSFEIGDIVKFKLSK
jgi:threonylcarbamoyladenosine tRNA methylthiotransferase MtaB